MSAIQFWLLSCLVNSLWQIPVLFLAGLLAARILRRIGPAAEHRVWTTVLVVSAALPIASTLPFDGLTSAFHWARSVNPADAHVTVLTGPGSALSGFGLAPRLLAFPAWAFAALCFWFAARFLWRCFRLKAIRRDAKPVTLIGEAAASWLRCSSRFGLSNIAVASSSRIFGPITFGLAHKLVILPTSLLSDADTDDLDAVLAHEFAHIRRNDFVKNLLCECIAVPVGYHPLLWAIRERVIETREMICDEMAAEPGGRHQYAESLLRLANLLLQGHPVTTPHAIGIFDANSFERRLMRLTETRPPVRGLRRIAMVAACTVFGLGIGSAALALHVRVDDQDAGGKPSQGTRPLAVRADIMQGQRIAGPVPVYPPDAKKAKIQGKVVLDAVIGKDGTVEKLTVTSGPKELQHSALDAVHQWTYKPFLLNGDPVDVKTTITVTYSLQK
jgi:TonB family protein